MECIPPPPIQEALKFHSSSFIILFFICFRSLEPQPSQSLVNYFVKLAISDLDRSLIEGPVVVVSSMGDC